MQSMQFQKSDCYSDLQGERIKWESNYNYADFAKFSRAFLTSCTLAFSRVILRSTPLSSYDDEMKNWNVSNDVLCRIHVEL
jgi:hypothetical protein